MLSCRSSRTSRTATPARDDRRQSALPAHDARRRRRRPLPAHLRRPPRALELRLHHPASTFTRATTRAPRRRSARYFMATASRLRRFGLRPLLFFGRRDGRRIRSSSAIFSATFRSTGQAAIGCSSGRSIIAATATESADVLFPLLYLRRSPANASASGSSAVTRARTASAPPSSGRFVRRVNEPRTRRRRCSSRSSPCTTHPTTRCASVLSRSSGASATAPRPTPPSSRSISAAARRRPLGRGVSALHRTRTRRRRHDSSLGPVWARTRTTAAAAAASSRSSPSAAKSAPAASARRGSACPASTPTATTSLASRTCGRSSSTAPIAPTATRPASSRSSSPGAKARRREVLAPTLLPLERPDQGRRARLLPRLVLRPRRQRALLGPHPVRSSSRRTSRRHVRRRLFPVFYAAKHLDGSTFVSPVGGSLTHDGLEAHRYRPDLLSPRRRSARRRLLPARLPPRNINSGARTSFCIPLYFDTRGGEGRELQAYTPLVWRYHSVESTTTVGLPLFLDMHAYGESRSTLLLPFFFHGIQQGHADDAAGCCRRSSPGGRRRRDGKDCVLLPAHLAASAAVNPTTIVAPLVWDFKRGPDSRTTVVFPLWAHWRRPEMRSLSRLSTSITAGARARAKAAGTSTSSPSSPSAGRARRTSSGTRSRVFSATPVKVATVTCACSGSSTSRYSRCDRVTLSLLGATAPESRELF